MSHMSYTNEQMQDARRLADALADVPEGKRQVFGLMVEAMLIGAELAEKRLDAGGADAPYCERAV